MLLWLLPTAVAAQVEPQLEQWVEETDDSEAAADLSDRLEALRTSPLNLNDTAALDELPMLSPFQRQALRYYIMLHGPLLGLEELRFVPGYDSAAVALLRGLVRVAPVPERRSWRLAEGRHTLVTALSGPVEQSAGYADGHYEGDALRAVAVYGYDLHHRLSLRVAADKDGGEPWGRGNYVAAHLALREAGRVELLVAGRYNLQFGQGLTLWTGLRPFGALGSGTLRYGAGLRTAATLYEQDYQQGLAARVRLARSLRLTAFASKAEGEALWGARLGWRSGNLMLGITSVWTALDSVATVRDYPYNQLRFDGRRQWNGGVDALWQRGVLTLYGEASLGENGAAAAVGGLRVRTGGHGTLGLSVRSLSRRYHNLHSQPYALGGGQGEQGATLEAATALPLGLRLTGSVDLHRFAVLRYASYSPSSGAWLRGQMERRWGGLTATVRCTYRLKERNIPNLDSTLYAAEQTLRGQWQGEVQWAGGPWQAMARGVYVNFDAERSGRQQGWMADVRAGYAAGRVQWVVAAALFDVEGYYARIYHSESNLQYDWTMPALTGRGVRAYVLMRWRAGEHLTLAAKYALTWLPGVEAIGSGDARTEGPHRQRWTLQLRWRL